MAAVPRGLPLARGLSAWRTRGWFGELWLELAAMAAEASSGSDSDGGEWGSWGAGAAAACDGASRGEAAALGPDSARSGGGGGRAAGALRERIEEEVQPTPEQKQAIAAIMSEQRAAGRQAMAGLSEEERRSAFRAARTELRTKIAAALDPERRAKFEALMQEGRPAAQSETTPGRVYVLDGEGQPKPIAVRLGPSDGAFTQVLPATGIPEGTEVVIGGGPRNAESAPASRGPAPRGPRLP
eukprot:gene34555-44322_t